MEKKVKRMVHCRATRAVLGALLLAFVLGAPPFAPSASASGPAFGFNYWPQTYSCDSLFDQNWQTQQAVVARDLDLMASLGVRVVRLMFFPQTSGYETSAGPAGRYSEVTTNLPALLKMLSDRKMQVIIAFGNNYTGWRDVNGDGIGDPGTQTHWEFLYGSTPQGWSNFLTHSKAWVDGIVNAAKNSPYASSILFYDYENEIHRGVKNSWEYLRYLYDYSAIPAGKRGVSVLHVPADSDLLATELQGRVLQFVDYHSYPRLAHANIESAYDAVRAKFPSAIIPLGEFGEVCVVRNPLEPCIEGKTTYNTTEAVQTSTVMDLINRSIAKGIPYYLQWMLWDNTPIAVDQKTALGYSPHEPKDALGAVAEKFSLVLNPDMEGGMSSVVNAWQVGSTAPFSTELWAGNNTAEAATRDGYTRITVHNQASGSAWLCSRMASTQGKTQLHMNFFFRTNMTGVQPGVVQYDSSGREVTRSHGPAFTASGWSWNNYLHRAGSWSVALQPTTTSVIVCMNGSMTAANPDYLDIDTVSVHAR